MTAPARRRTLTAVLLTMLTVASCGSAERTDSGGGATCEVRQETDQITSRFPSFGRLKSTSWCGYTLGTRDDARIEAPGPTDTRLVGLLDAMDDKALRKDLADPALQFKPATPADLPPEIDKLLPEGAEWMVSERINATITEDLYPGTFYYDRRSGQVLFDCVNPFRKEDHPAVVPNQ